MSASPGGVGSALNYVDNQIHEDGVDRLKLLMYAVLKPVWRELAKCKKASAIYHMLEGHLGCKEKAMQMFLFALKAIGGSKRGKQSAKEVSQILRPPKELEFEQQTETFRFFFWLLKVARRLPDDCHKKIKQHFARTKKINPRYIESIPQLFIKLYQDKVLSECDTSPLMKVLEQYEKCYGQDTPEQKNMRKCMAYLHKFHDGEADPFSSGDEESSAPSMSESQTDTHTGHEEHPAVKSKDTRRQKKRKKKVSESTPVSYQFVFEPEDTPVAPKDSSDSPSPYGCSPPRDIQGLGSPRLEIEGSVRLFHPVSGSTPCAASVGTITPQDRLSGQLPSAKPHHQSTGAASVDGGSTAWGSGLPVQHSINSSVEPVYISFRTILPKCFTITKGCIITLLSILAIVIVVLAAVVVCSKYVWLPLHHLSPYEAKQYEGSIPILGEVNPFLTETITVKQDVDFDDSSHEISVYIAKKKCHSLPTITTSTLYNEEQLSIHPVYMLEQSEITMYNICASTDGSESNPIVFFILKGISEYIDFNPRDKNSYYKYHTFKVGTHGNNKCKHITWNISERDYYSVKIFRPSTPSITLSYNLTMHTRHLDIEAMNKTNILIEVGVIESDNDDNQKTSRDIPFATKKYCLFAEIEKTTIQSTNNFTSLEVVPVPRYGAPLVITVIPFVSFIIITVVVVIFVKICIYYKNRNYDRLI